MQNIFLRLGLAVVVAIIVSGFFAGYKSDSIYVLDLVTAFSFILATVITTLLGGVACCVPASSCKPSSSKPSSGKPSAGNPSPAQANGSQKREKGSVKWFNVSKGFGFITRENGEDIFVHYRSIRGEGRRRLFDGQAVEFLVVDSDKGLQAEEVDIIS